MGKRYATELKQLEDTYAWANQASIQRLSAEFARLGQQPLLAVGSGGSYSVAATCAYLHQYFTGAIAKAGTPLDAVLSETHGQSHGIIFISAGGSNPDIIGAVDHLASREPTFFSAICTRTGSALAKLAKEHHSLSLFEFDLPSGKDGFLATNSLLATAVFLVRAYQHTNEATLPATLANLVRSPGMKEFQTLLEERAKALWSNRTIVVLYSPSTYPAALDFESKFTEAALGNVQIADYRNFAHGRHHWIAKEHGDTAVLAFLTSEIRQVGEITLSALPKNVVSLALDVGQEGPSAAISALTHVLYLVGLAGAARGMDPGKPHIPLFGRKIYHLKAFDRLNLGNGISKREAISLQRKTGKLTAVLETAGELAFWREHYRSFIQRLSIANIQAVIFDYDGTLCDPAYRFIGANPDLMKHLAKLIKAGISIGVVTGRGQSVRDSLREGLPRSAWSHISVGYYNGAVIASLSENGDLATEGQSCPSFTSFSEALRQETKLLTLAKIEYRPYQISLMPKNEQSRPVIWEILQRYLSLSPGARTFESGHSVDALAPGVSKLNLVSYVRQKAQIRERESVLCIGDCGRWPGNDFELLSEPSSLSVATVTTSPDTCWNIALPENRLTTATCEYFTDLFRLRYGTLKLTESLMQE